MVVDLNCHNHIGGIVMTAENNARCFFTTLSYTATENLPYFGVRIYSVSRAQQVESSRIPFKIHAIIFIYGRLPFDIFRDFDSTTKWKNRESTARGRGHSQKIVTNVPYFATQFYTKMTAAIVMIDASPFTSIYFHIDTIDTRTTVVPHLPVHLSDIATTILMNVAHQIIVILTILCSMTDIASALIRVRTYIHEQQTFSLYCLDYSVYLSSIFLDPTSVH